MNKWMDCKYQRGVKRIIPRDKQGSFVAVSAQKIEIQAVRLQYHLSLRCTVSKTSVGVSGSLAPLEAIDYYSKCTISSILKGNHILK